MKTIHHLLALLFLSTMLTSCFFGTSENEDVFAENDFERNMNTEGFQENENRGISANKNKLVLKVVKDPKTGMVMMGSPLPKSWNVNKDQDAPIYITAPNNILVKKTETYNYAYAQGAFERQSIQQMGIQLAPVQSLQEIVQQQMIPYLNNNGYIFIKNYPVKDYENFLNRLISGMYNSGAQRNVFAMATEWKKQDGTMALIVLSQVIHNKESFTNWQLLTTELNAPVPHFENASKTFLFGLANTQINPKWQQANNQQMIANQRQTEAYWANQTRIGNARHQRNMEAINAVGNTSRNIAGIYSDISDISHNGYLKRSGMNDVGHSKSVDGIYGNTTVFNPNQSGQTYKVESYDNYYYGNNQGDVIGTDNSLYNPNLDSNVNNQDWTQYEIDN